MELKGFLDLHTHGIGKYDTRTNNASDLLKVADLHGRAGTDALCFAIYAGPVDVMRQNIDAVRKAIELQKKEAGRQHFSGEKVKSQATIVGVHLEGPFLNPHHCGSLDKKEFIKPSISRLKRLLDGNEDLIKVMTIAPEISGALKVIEKCSELGIRINMGHSDASYDEAL